MTQSMGVSLCDILRNVIKRAVDDEPAECLESVLKWFDDEDSAISPAAWIGEHVVDTAAFRTALKTPDHSVTSLLEQCKAAAAAYADCPVADTGPNAAGVQAAVELLASRWAGADLDGDEEDEESSYKYARTVGALKKAQDQLPMLVAVQQALSLFPDGLAEKLDAQAASVGDSVRKQTKANKKMKPGDLINTVMQNPAFMDMMKTMMEQDQGADADAATHEQQRALGARLSLIELRLSKLEKAAGASAAAAPKQQQRKKKAKGGRTTTHTPTY